jgi:hypothetical protein
MYDIGPEAGGHPMSWKDSFRAALPAALVALAVTPLRLAGELRGWSEAWFSRATGGLLPAGLASVLVGITWLFWTCYVMLAFVPQLVFWVAYTVVVGMLAGTLAMALGPAFGWASRGNVRTANREGRG